MSCVRENQLDSKFCGALNKDLNWNTVSAYEKVHHKNKNSLRFKTFISKLFLRVVVWPINVTGRATYRRRKNVSNIVGNKKLAVQLLTVNELKKTWSVLQLQNCFPADDFGAISGCRQILEFFSSIKYSKEIAADLFIHNCNEEPASNCRNSAIFPISPRTATATFWYRGTVHAVKTQMGINLQSREGKRRFLLQCLFGKKELP